MVNLPIAEWMQAVADPEIDGAIESIYADAALETERQRPICLASGHCCHFDAYGHDLFVTGLETAWFFRRLHTESATPEPRAPHGSPGSERAGAIKATRHALPLAPSRAGRVCPWLDGRLCGARAARPLGCRVFHCDSRADGWMNALLEGLHARIRTVHERHAVIYHYGEWLRMLDAFAEHLRNPSEH